MTRRFRSWWNTRTRRERGLLLVAAGLAAIVFAWLLVVRPLAVALDNARERHDAAVALRAQVENQIAAIRAARSGGDVTQRINVLDLVEQDAARVGFSVSRIEAVGTDGARVIVAAARPQAFFAWVGHVETQLGLDVEALTARPNADETLSVDVTFRGGR